MRLSPFPLLLLWAVCLAWPQAASAQLVDTVEDPFITANDTINRDIEVLGGFDVVLVKPELVSGSGVAVKNGFDDYYIHVVKVTEAYVNGAPVVVTDSQETYYAVASKLSRLRLQGDSISSRALFLKGIVFGAGARDQQATYDSLAVRYYLMADSLDEHLKTAFLPPASLVQRAKDLRRMARNCEVTVEAYRDLRGAGRKGTDVARFFLKHYLNQSDRYNLYTHPFGLPLVRKAEELDKKGNVVDPNDPKAKAGKKRKRRSGLRKLWDRIFS